VRLFLAINLDPELRRAIVDAAAPLRQAAPTLAWADDAKLHLTLKFLGEHPDDTVESLSVAADAVAARHSRFSMRIGEVGAFPNFRRARVVWMGVEREPRLELLHHDVEVACETLGFEVEGRAFRPHLTLARVRGERTEIDELRRLARASKRVDFTAEADVTSIDLMRSAPGPGGSARYERLHAARLTDAGGRR
jgi:RNA 2',3'-cyclic 3'-phosphodiesterase